MFYSDDLVSLGSEAAGVTGLVSGAHEEWVAGSNSSQHETTAATTLHNNILLTMEA